MTTDDIPYRKREHAETDLSRAIDRLRRRSWSELSVLLGVPASTIRHWLIVPPVREGRSVQIARQRLIDLGLLDRQD